MRISLNITEYSWPGTIADGLDRTARAAEAAGLDTVWVADHLIQAHPMAQVTDPMLEACTTLGYLAARTETVNLGTMVAAVTFRPPALLIKAVTTLDVLSGGRAWFGVGAGYHQAEADMMGLPLPPTGERFDRLEETVRIAEAMFAGDEAPFEGRHHRLTRPVNSPLPIGSPKLLIGGMGERRTLPLVAAHADACNLPDVPDGGATIRAKLAVLRQACERAGRDYGEIAKTVSTKLSPGQSAESFAEHLRELEQLGLDHAVVITDGGWTEEGVAVLGRARRALA
ncbi:LLM class flavin-dependent oxidoreductase [Amycolatopsis suaedae]|uniref:LLM class flavin-dependent oxidoreductase n=1 Tax=Amycolatopsis suaedae TaxID=2510978 RepID=A0A4V2EMA7_9PSEU|nr:LLM class flavin-dependent oxidoreductase [Amycolatopsis suaedae]RZQ64405.1 LLM class flavin-dependent oxidoreductase [Amycolatopsis suaedae]